LQKWMDSVVSVAVGERGIWTRDEERSLPLPAARFGWKSWRAPPASPPMLKTCNGGEV
jgi:hypothetical protein